VLGKGEEGVRHGGGSLRLGKKEEGLMAVRSYREIVWQKAMELAELVYQTTENYPKSEVYGLAAHTRKSAVSVPSNVAEGQGRWSTADFVRFLSIAHGSLLETETQLLLGARLGFLDKPSETRLLALSSEVGRLIYGLANSLAAPRRTTTDD
jgi:four helix bundle protein